MSHDQLDKSEKNVASIVEAKVFSLKRKEVKQFLSAVVFLLLIIVVVMSKAMIGGAIDEYHIPLSHWTAEMYVTQCFMIAVYSLIFTGLLSIPLWYWFLGKNDDK